MKNLTKLALTGALIFGLNSCGDNKKYQDFAKFVEKEGKKILADESGINFSKGNKEYVCVIILSDSNYKFLAIGVEGEKFRESFIDENLNGLNYYHYDVGGKDIVNDFSFFQSIKNKNKYEMLIDSLPKWYGEYKRENALNSKDESECDPEEITHENMMLIDFNQDKKVDYILIKHTLFDDPSGTYSSTKLVDADYDGTFETQNLYSFGKEKNKEIECGAALPDYEVQKLVRRANKFESGEYHVHSNNKIFRGFRKIGIHKVKN